jgi:hypothetical protein
MEEDEKYTEEEVNMIVAISIIVFIAGSTFGFIVCYAIDKILLS